MGLENRQINRQRIGYVDAAKGLGIYLVVLGHLFQKGAWDFIPGGGYCASLTQLIYSFHMPFFFMIFGFTWKLEIFSDFNEARNWLLKKMRAYLIPYILMMIISDGLSWRKLFDYLLPKQEILLKYSPLASWWLPCLFLAALFFQILIQIAYRLAKRDSCAKLLYCFASCALLLIGLYILNGKIGNIYYYANIALVGVGFIAGGTILRTILDKIEFEKINRYILFSLLLMLMILIFFIAGKNQTVFMVIGQYGNPLCFLTTGLAGSVALLIGGVLLNKRQINFFGRNSLIVMQFHGLVISLIESSFVNLLWGQRLQNELASPLFRVLLAALAMVLTIPIIWVINRYFPIVTGKFPSIKKDKGY